MNRKVHLGAGTALFLAFACGTGLFHRTSISLLIFGLGAAAAGSLFPDILEPPTSAKHLDFFHCRRSLAFAGAVFVLTTVPVVFVSGLPHLPLFVACSSFFLGYSAHLLADSLTQAGLPG
jgi:hypothetical protein